MSWLCRWGGRSLFSRPSLPLRSSLLLCGFDWSRSAGGPRTQRTFRWRWEGRFPLLHHGHPLSCRQSHVDYFRDGLVFPPRSHEHSRVFIRCGLARGYARRPARVYHSASGRPHVSFHGEPDHMYLERANIVQRLSKEEHSIVKLLGEPALRSLGQARLEEGCQCSPCRHHGWYFRGYHINH